MRTSYVFLIVIVLASVFLACEESPKEPSNTPSNDPSAFTVWFDTQGGNEVKPQIVEKEKKVSKPADPTRTGYKFVYWNWYKDSGIQVFDFDVETITADIVLYAGWGVEIPDANFRTQLKSYVPGAFIDDLLLLWRSDLTTQYGMGMSLTPRDSDEKKISSLSGIEHLTALSELDARYNSLTELDMFNNTLLVRLDVGANQLKKLDVSKNKFLTSLHCYRNQLTSLDVSKNPLLDFFECERNSLTTLDVSKNLSLTNLYCGNNSLDSLDMSKNLSLTTLDCPSNSLDSLDMSKNTSLFSLDCRSNSLTKLDIRGMRFGGRLYIDAGEGDTNPITELKVHDALKNHAEIKKAKTKLGSKITIRTYSADGGSSSYTLTCNNYDPNGGADGKGSCTQGP